MSSSYGFARNFIVIGLGRLATQFIGLILLPIYTYNMPSASYGTLDLVVTLSALCLPLMTLHLEMAGFRFLIDCRDDQKGSQRIVGSLLHATTYLILGWAVIVGTVAFIYVRPLAIWICLYFCSLIASGMMLQIARGLGRNTSYAISTTVTAGITLLLTFLTVVKGGGGVGGALLSLAIGNLAGAVSIALHRDVWRAWGASEPARNWRPMLSYSIPLIPNSISWWAISGLDRVVVLGFMSLHDVGLLAYGAKISSVLTALATIYSLTWSEAASVRQHQRAEETQRHFTLVFWTFSLTGASVISGLGWLLPLVTPTEYFPALQYVPLLVLGSVLYAFTTFFGGLYVAGYQSARIGGTSVIAAIVKILLALGTVPWIGLWGAALSTVASYGCLCILRYADLLRLHYRLRLPRLGVVMSIISITLATIIYYYAPGWAGLGFGVLCTVVALMRLLNVRNVDRSPGRAASVVDGGSVINDGEVH